MTPRECLNDRVDFSSFESCSLCDSMLFWYSPHRTPHLISVGSSPTSKGWNSLGFSHELFLMTSLDDLIHSHGFKCLLCVKDSQIYISGHDLCKGKLTICKMKSLVFSPLKSALLHCLLFEEMAIPCTYFFLIT